MSRQSCRRRPTTCARTALTLAEAIVCLAIVSVMLVASLSSVSAAKVVHRRTADREQAFELARELLNEVLAQSYQEPVTTPTFGSESGESAGSRANFDDVDDFTGWVASPPQDRDGTIRGDLAGWTERITVERVRPTAPDTVQSSESGVKRITVEIERYGITMARLRALRSDAWTENLPE